MEKYDDYAVSPQNFEAMAKEYNKCIQSNMLNIKHVADVSTQFDENAIKSLFNKIEYLRVLINDLKNQTKNQDILTVLSQITDDIQSQINLLSDAFKTNFVAKQDNEDEFKMFCNKLKLAINTTSDIVKLLIGIKDDENTISDIKLILTSSINGFLDINNELVSLFGECRYLRR